MNRGRYRLPTLNRSIPEQKRATTPEAPTRIDQPLRTRAHSASA